MTNILSSFLQNFSNFFRKIESRIPKFAGIFYVVLSSFLFTFGYLLAKLLNKIPLNQMMHLSSLVSLSLCFLTDSTDIIPKNNVTYRLLIQRGAVGATALVLYYQSVYLLPLSLAALLNLLSPLWIGILSVVINHEHYSLKQFIITLICFFGLILIIQPDFIFHVSENHLNNENNENYAFYGVIIGILASFMTAVVFLTIRVLKGKVSIILILFYYNFFGVIFAGGGMIFENCVLMSRYEIIMSIFVGVFLYLAQICRNRALFLEKPFIVGILSYTILIFSYLCDIFIFKKPMNFTACMGSFIVIVSLIYLTYIKSKSDNQ